MTAYLDEKIEEIRRLHALAERWRLEHAGFVAWGYKAELEVSVKCCFVGEGGVVAIWDRRCNGSGRWLPDALWRPGQGGYDHDATLGDLEAYLFAPDREVRDLRLRLAEAERVAEDAAEERDELRRKLASLESAVACEVTP